MVLHFIGIGLYDEQDITVRGLKIVQQCCKVYLEAYTSILQVDKSKLEELYGKEVIIADRNDVEIGADTILSDAKDNDVAFLVVGDAFGATTHTDLQLRAKELGISTNIVHNVSIINAVGCCGLSLYNYGQAVSIVLFTDTWRPESFYDKIINNKKMGFHTLCLLDIKVKEPTMESLARGKPVYQDPIYMTINQALEQLMSISEPRACDVITSDTLVIGCARLGAPNETIKAGKISDLLSFDFGGPLHSLVIPGEMSDIEKQAVESFV